jgi:hypothetical protein
MQVTQRCVLIHSAFQNRITLQAQESQGASKSLKSDFIGGTNRFVGVLQAEMPLGASNSQRLRSGTFGGGYGTRVPFTHIRLCLNLAIEQHLGEG